jgi:N-acetylglucosaminyl-diphospho-decaprenol L-rhamnosyltransferase
MGAFMLIRAETFKRIGYFDERFFVYFEELDFSKRLAEAGGKTFYNYEITAIHSGGGTTQNVKAFRLALSLHSRLKYSKKHFNELQHFFISFCTLIIEPLTRVLFFVVKLNFKGIKEVVEGYKLLYKELKARI